MFKFETLKLAPCCDEKINTFLPSLLPSPPISVSVWVCSLNEGWFFC